MLEAAYLFLRYTSFLYIILIFFALYILLVQDSHK